MFRAGTSESVIKAIMQLMEKVLEREGSASWATGGRDRTIIVWHEQGPYEFYLLIQYMNKAGPDDEGKWDRSGTRRLMRDCEVHVSGSDMTDEKAKSAADDGIWAIFDVRIVCNCMLFGDKQ